MGGRVSHSRKKRPGFEDSDGASSWSSSSAGRRKFVQKSANINETPCHTPSREEKDAAKNPMRNTVDHTEP